MAPDDGCAGIPVFLDSAAGRVFAIYHRPVESGGNEPAILYLPPFAEEMNRSRRMVSLQARALAAAGYGALLLDPYGTGDSEGDFGDARVSSWLSDIACAATWLRQQGHRSVELWGLRFGALLAAVAMSRDPASFSGLLLWHPVTDGRTLITQFLRIALAASLGERDASISTEALRGRLRDGQSVEAGGYELRPDLATDIDALALGNCGLSPGSRVHWFEVGSDPAAPISAMGARAIEQWRNAGVVITAGRVPGPQFWLTAEITVAPALIEVTTDALRPRQS